VRTCDTCPGGADCAGDNLVAVLAEVYGLYRSGLTDKFEILFALSDQAEALFERYNDQVSRICWTRAALAVIADVLAHMENDDSAEPFAERVRQVLVTAVGAFEKFPWFVSGLIGQAPELYDAICYAGDGVALRLSKRDFVKLCKDVVYNK